MPRTADEIISLIGRGDVERLKGQLTLEKRRTTALSGALEKAQKLWGAQYTAPKPRRALARGGQYYTRLAVGDTHGNHISIPARDAFLGDLEILKPEEVVLLGDLLDCSGTFSRFKKQYLREFSYSYSEDVSAANDFLDQVQRRVPSAKCYYLEGNHERRIEAWAVEQFENVLDAKKAVDAFGPRAALHLDKRGIAYYEYSLRHMGLEAPGVIKLGKCFFAHGFGKGIHASYNTLRKLADNIVHGHNHRSMSSILRQVDSTSGAWCPGCLCDIQPYYFHSDPTDHTNGYHVQFVNRKTGWFAPWNVSVLDGVSVLPRIKEVLG